MTLSVLPCTNLGAQDRQSSFFPSGVSASSRLIFFEIASQPVSEALIAFALQGNLSIGLQEVDASGLVTQRLSGLYTTGEGLRRLLNNTGFEFSFVDEGTVRVYRAESRAPVQPARMPVRRTTEPVIQQTRFRLEELIVTSTKRERDPQDVPMSIATVGSERLNAMQVRDTDDLVSLVAGLSSTNQGPGRNKIFLRGQSDGPVAERTQSTVGIYIDESPLVFSDTNPDFRLIDVERIEVLRGPQGTLFGAGSLGGTFRIITNKPDPDNYRGRVSVGGAFTNGGTPTLTSDGMINVPLVEGRSALRVAAFYDRFGGFIDDLQLDEENVNEASILGGRMTIATDIGDDWSAIVSSNFQEIDLDDTQYYSPNLEALIRANLVPEPRKDKFLQGGLTLEGKIGPLDMVANTTFIRRRIQNQSDASTSVPDLLGLTLRPSPFISRNKISTLAQEVRFAYTGRRWDWLMGGFYLDRNENLKTSFTVPGAGAAFETLGFPSDEVFAEDRDDDVKQFAGFADITFAATPRLNIGLGARLGRATLDVSSLTSGIVSARIEETDLTNGATHFNPRISVNYAVAPATNVYAQMARGFRVGGVNINTPVSALFDPGLDEDEQLETQTFSTDTLWNYEIGFKSRLLDNRLSVNAAAFYVDWTDIQTDQILPTGFLFVTNAGNARNIGIELQIAAQLTDNLTVTAAAIWNDPSLQEANAFLNANKGDRLPSIAAFTGGLSLQYAKPINSRLNFIASADYTYVGPSRLFFDRDTSPRQGDNHRANVRLGFEWDRWQARFYVTNLFDHTGNTFAFGNSFSLNATSQFTPLRPRTLGLDIARTF